MNKIILITAIVFSSQFANARESEDFLSDLGVNSAQVTPELAATLQTEMDQVKYDDQSQPEEVDLNHLKIMGRGFVDEKNGDSIALACAGTIDPVTQVRECSSLRHVFFDHQSFKAHFVGKTYLIGFTKVNDDAAKREIKEINKDFKQSKRRAHYNRNAILFGGTGFAGVYAIWQLSPAAWMVGAAGSLPMACVAGFGFVVVWSVVGAMYGNNGTMFASSAGSSDVLRDQNGWNWPSRPKEVKHSTFELYRNFLGFRSEEGMEKLRCK